MIHEFKKTSGFAALIIAVCLMLAFCMCGCTEKKSDTMIIRESVAEVLGNFDSPDSEISKRFVFEMDIKELEKVGMNTDDFMKAYFNGFDYKIDDIRINGSSADVDLTIYVKSFTDFEARFAEEIEELSEHYVVVDESEDSSSSASASSNIDANNNAAENASAASAENAENNATDAAVAANSTSSASASSADDIDKPIEVSTEEMNTMFRKAIIDCLKETPVQQTKQITITFNQNDNKWVPSPTAFDDVLTAMIEA